MDKLRQKYIALQKAFWDTDGDATNFKHSELKF